MGNNPTKNLPPNPNAHEGEPFLFARDPDALKVPRTRDRSTGLIKCQEMIVAWQQENKYNLQQEDIAARVRASTEDSRRAIGSLTLATLFAYVLTTSHRPDVYYFPLKAYIVKQITKFRPWKQVGFGKFLLIQATCVITAVSYTGRKSVEGQSHYLTYARTPLGYQFRKLVEQVDPTMIPTDPRISSYDNTFEQKYKELLDASIKQQQQQQQEQHLEEEPFKSSVPPRYQKHRQQRIKRGSYYHEEDRHAEEEHLNNNNSNEEHHEE
ncbi:hypothetical protein ABK040_006415 [Willaertia magna]